MTLRALLFDVDGTLAETERLAHRPAYNKAFKDLGLQWRWTPRLYRDLLHKTGGRERLQHYIEHYRPNLGSHASAADSDVRAWTQDVHDVKSRHFNRIVQQGRVPLRHGVARLIRSAHAAGLTVAVVTSASRASLEPLLEYSLGQELTGLLALTVCGEDVAHKKPAPDLYQLALKRLELSPHQCFAIEDSASGLAAAHAAGVLTVITVNSETRSQDFAGAALVVDSLGEPDHPPKVLQGDLHGEPCVTVRLLQEIAEAAVAPPKRAAVR